MRRTLLLIFVLACVLIPDAARAAAPGSLEASSAALVVLETSIHSRSWARDCSHLRHWPKT